MRNFTAENVTHLTVTCLDFHYYIVIITPSFTFLYFLTFSVFFVMLCGLSSLLRPTVTSSCLCHVTHESFEAISLCQPYCALHSTTVLSQSTTFLLFLSLRSDNLASSSLGRLPLPICHWMRHLTNPLRRPDSLCRRASDDTGALTCLACVSCRSFSSFRGEWATSCRTCWRRDGRRSVVVTAKWAADCR